MCQVCDKAVIEMGILESDLPNLPYKLVKWHCVCDGCNGATKLRDYGVSPYYFWPVKILRSGSGDEQKWRGGWTSFMDAYICSKHFAQYKLDSGHFWKKYLFGFLKTNNIHKIHKYLITKITPIEKSKLYKHNDHGNS